MYLFCDSPRNTGAVFGASLFPSSVGKRKSSELVKLKRAFKVDACC